MRNLNWIGDHINFSPPCYRSSSDPCSHHKMCPGGALSLGASPASRQIPKTIEYIYTTGMIFHLSMHIRYIHCINKTSFFNTFPFQSYHRERERYFTSLANVSLLPSLRFPPNPWIRQTAKCALLRTLWRWESPFNTTPIRLVSTTKSFCKETEQWN